MRLDGEVFAFGDSYLLSDNPGTSQGKVAMVCQSDPAGLIASGWSALWVHGVAGQPVKHEVCVRMKHRAIHRTESTRVVRELKYHTTEVIEFAHGAALTIERAVCDVLRLDHRGDETVVVEVAAVIHYAHINTRGCRAILKATAKLPYRVLAEKRLALIDAIHVVNAIDATHGIEHALEVHRVTGLKNESAKRETL